MQGLTETKVEWSFARDASTRGAALATLVTSLFGGSNDRETRAESDSGVLAGHLLARVLHSDASLPVGRESEGRISPLIRIAKNHYIIEPKKTTTTVKPWHPQQILKSTEDPFRKGAGLNGGGATAAEPAGAPGRPRDAPVGDGDGMSAPRWWRPALC
ncbi:hypothetical protein MTO96_021223 [Rhipicephalus appendiculatus]